MKNEHNNRSWKNFLIRRDVQFPLVGANLAFLIIVTAIIVAVLLSPLYLEMLESEDLWTQHVSANLFLLLLQRISLAMLLILVVAAVHQVVLSHRFCGPLVNFNKTFKKMLQGDFSRRVLLRKGDFLKIEAERVNGIIDRLTEDGKRLDENLARIAEIAGRLEGQDPDSPQAEQLRNLKESVATCRETVKLWRLPTDAESQEDESTVRHSPTPVPMNQELGTMNHEL